MPKFINLPMVLTGSGATGMDGLTTAITSLMSMVGDMLNTILGNPVLALLFAAGIIGIVIGIVKKLKRV